MNLNLKLWLDTVTTAFIVVGGILALLQLRQTHKQRSRESALQMLHSFQTPEFLTAVNIVFDLPDGLSKEGVEQRLRDKVTCLLVMMGTFESLSEFSCSAATSTLHSLRISSVASWCFRGKNYRGISMRSGEAAGAKRTMSGISG